MMMKIKPEHYDHMRSAIQEVVKKLPDGIEGYRQELIAEGKAKDIEKRLRWDMSYLARLTPFICENIYSYANDDHVDTALRRIMQEVQNG
jgi:hypothetical protein